MIDNFQIFKVFDQNNSGRISKEEFISTMAPEGSVNWNQMLYFFDTKKA